MTTPRGRPSSSHQGKVTSAHAPDTPPPTTRRAKTLVARLRALGIGHPCYWWHAAGWCTPVHDWTHNSKADR